eukprot:1143533-Pelagomonas_calceolata.AAC.10
MTKHDGSDPGTNPVKKEASSMGLVDSGQETSDSIQKTIRQQNGHISLHNTSTSRWVREGAVRQRLPQQQMILEGIAAQERRKPSRQLCVNLRLDPGHTIN